MVSFMKMLPGDALISEIRRNCKGTYKSINLEIAEQLARYNAMYDENLTMEEFIEAYYPKNASEAKENPE